MKNLMKVLRSSFLTKMAFTATVLAVLMAFASCKHDKGGDPKPKPKVEEVTLTLEKGANVTKVEPASVKWEKGKALKLSVLKAKISKMEFAANYEFGKLCIGAENGVEIKEDESFKPEKDTKVFVVAKAKGTPPGPGPQPGDVTLASVKVGANPVTVADMMDAGSVTSEEVDVEFTTNPADATLSFSPTLKAYDAATKKGKWALTVGENSIKITVTKESKTKEYTLKLKRVAEDEPILESLKVGGVAITPKEEPEFMTHNVESDKDKVKVEFAANTGSTVATTPSITSGADWALAVGENTLKFTVTKGAKTRNYTLKVTREAEAPKITSITVGPHKKEGDGIVEFDTADPKVIEIPVPTEFDGIEHAAKVDVDVEGATVEWDPPLDNDKVVFGPLQYLTDLKKDFTITVAKDGKERKYKVQVLMMTNAAGFFGARVKGKSTSSELGEIEKVLRHQDVTLQIAGKEAQVIFVSQLSKWQGVYYNGQDVKQDMPPNARFKGMGMQDVPLPIKGGKSLLEDKTLGDDEIEVVVSNSAWEKVDGKEYYKAKEPWLATEVFRFKIARHAEKADAFIQKVLVNDRNVTNEEKDPEAFTALFAESDLAEFNTGKKADVVVELSKKVKSVKIKDTTLNEDAQEEVGDKDGKVTKVLAKATNIQVNEDGTPTEVVVVVTPKDEDNEYYGETTMKFNLVYKKPPELIPAVFGINEDDYFDIPAAFRTALAEGKEPPYTVKSNLLAMSFIFVGKPSKVEMDIDGTKTSAEDDKIVEVKNAGGASTYTVNLTGVVASTEKTVTLIFTPENDGAFSEGKWVFKVTGTDDKPKLEPKFQRIGKDANMSEEFLTKLTGSDAEYATAEESAEFLITLTEYEHDFLLDEIKIDDVKATDEEFKLIKSFFSATWELKKTVEGLTPEGKEVKIEFIGKNAGTTVDNITWKFKLKSGGEKPIVPEGTVSLGVADFGGNGFPFTEEFLDGLKKKTEPVLEVYGKDVEIYFRTYTDAYLKSATFKLDDNDEVSVDAEDAVFVTMAKHKFENVSKDQEHTVIAKFEPASADYKGSEYKFKLKVVDDLPMPSGYIFGLNGKIRTNGYKAILEEDFANLIFQVNQDVVEEVKMGKEGEMVTVDLEKLQGSGGRFFWNATKDIDLNTASPEDWIIEVTPKDKDKYAVVKFKYNLQGKAIDENNASFVISGARPKVYAKVTWKDGIPEKDRYTDDYGAKSVAFTAYTMSKESTVKAKRVHTITNEDMPEPAETSLAREGTTRELKGSLEAFDDKPTKMKLVCTGKNGTTVDVVNGVYTASINPVPMYWSYRKIAAVEDGDAGYAEIKVSKAKIKKNTVYVLFAPWQEKFGYTVDRDAVSEGQTKPEALGPLGSYQQIFRTSLDVKDLEVGQSKEVKLRLVYAATDTEALVYKVKVTMEN